MNSKLFFNAVPVVLLTIATWTGMNNIARACDEVQDSPAVQQSAQKPETQAEQLDRLMHKLKAEDPEARWWTARGLGKMGEAAIPRLLPLLKDTNPQQRSIAAIVFYHMGPTAKSMIPNLLPLLRDSDVEVRDSALQALNQIDESGETSTANLKLLLNDSNPEIRSFAAKALKRID